MPRRVSVTEEHLDYLRSAVASGSISYPEMARRIGVCTDTCKRILHKHGIVEFTGAKYVVSRPIKVDTWTRPCMGCRSTEPRPRNHYFCSDCRRSRGYDGE